MHRCSGIKPNGGRCERIVSQEQDYCYSHDPARQTERRRNAARGGKAKAAGEIGQIKAEVHAVIASVLTRRIERSVGAVAFQGFNTLLKALETERKLKELTELEERISALEESKGERWRA